MPHTDSNYGNIFSIWDRIFGTYKELDKNKIIYGIDDDYDDKNNLIKILKRPFRKF
jgi:sterol desaturase/sphingolipid hydroxylase (fatty acid hydroxylase superfamily)